MSKSDKKNAEYAAQVEANLSRLYQNYLDRLNEKTGRQITKEDLDTQEKRDRLAQEWKTRNLGLGEGSNPEPSTNRDGESKLSSSKREK